MDPLTIGQTKITIPSQHNFLGLWEHRKITIFLYSDQNELPCALLLYPNKEQKFFASGQIYFGINKIQGTNLVSIIQNLSREMTAGELALERHTAAIVQGEELYFLLPLMGAGFPLCGRSSSSVAPKPISHNGGFIKEEENLSLWPLSSSQTPSNTLHGCKNTHDIVTLWRNGTEETKKQCAEIALKIVTEYQAIVPKQKKHIMEVLPLSIIPEVSFPLLQSFSSELGTGEKLDNPFVTMGLVYFLHLVPDNFIKRQASGNLKTVLLQLNDRIANLTPTPRTFFSKLIKKEMALPDPSDLLAAIEAFNQIMDAIVDAGVPVLNMEDKNRIHLVLDHLLEHADFRVSSWAAYAKESLMRTTGQEPHEYLVLCQTGRTLMLMNQMVHGVATANINQVSGAMTQINLMYQTTQGLLSNKDEVMDKAHSWYPHFRKCESYLMFHCYKEFLDVYQKIKPNSDNLPFPKCLLLLLRKIVQTHPDLEMRKKCIEYVGMLLNPAQWGNQPDLKREIVCTLSSIALCSELPLSDLAHITLSRYQIEVNRNVEPMIYLTPSSNFPTTLFENAKKLSLAYLEQLENSAKLDLEKRNFLAQFNQFLPITLNNGDNLLERTLQFLGDNQKDFLIVNGSHGCGKTFFCRYLEWQLWQKFDQYRTIPLYISLEEVKNKQELKDVIPRLFQKKGCQQWIDEAKKTKVLLIFDHFEEMPDRSQLAEDCDLTQWLDLKVLVMNGASTLPNLAAIVFCTPEGAPLLDKCLTVDIANLNSQDIKKFAETNIESQQQQLFLSICKRQEMQPLTTVYFHLYLLSKVFTKSPKGNLLNLLEAFVQNWLETHKNLSRHYNQEDQDFYRFMEIIAWYSYCGDNKNLWEYINKPDHRKNFWGPLVFARECPLCQIETVPFTFKFTHQLFQYYFLANLFIRTVKKQAKGTNDPFLSGIWKQLYSFPFEEIKSFLIEYLKVDDTFIKAVETICASQKSSLTPEILPLHRLVKHIPPQKRTPEATFLHIPSPLKPPSRTLSSSFIKFKF